MNKNSPKSNLTKLSYLSTMEKQIYDLDHIIFFVDCITFMQVRNLSIIFLKDNPSAVILEPYFDVLNQ